MNRNHNIIKWFFACMGVGFIILCWKVRVVSEHDPIKEIKFLAFYFWYLLIISLWLGIFCAVLIEVYRGVKKKLQSYLNLEYLFFMYEKNNNKIYGAGIVARVKKNRKQN